ncbi:MAG TPA: Crp/Fnr family transcriptional regulator [Deltaproteobacteria bacterium]|jgi:CRP/FNR family transcriptional regulator|nr:Crp/Fnr family transcriptional regulator [Deltaproteobacteria bacterium]HRW81053.1 Crp/Fnr family transcriptional regulator [Desulfomonilia bacterium]NMD40627.1 Crp/Fnr family transcriptional regulator [Deltaproteobacteria bacterium]HNQ86790.1 Crp/Fnr family transcriptional regulator [Deltaproteobacteria bacterium]HNS90997.1 Crp/Fnr family transcriptional regulator [Deltaproteobacteria bacterium]
MELRDLLKQAGLFRGMSDDSLARLEARGRQKGFGQGGTLFVEGAKGSEFFLLLEGEVRLYKTSPEGQEVALRIVRPGEVFAEVVLFENHVYPVSASALSRVRVFAMDRHSFADLLDEKDFRNEFIAMLMKKQRYLAGRILYLTSFDVEERFFRFLIEHYGTGGTYSVDMAKKDMASAIGTIPETFSRLINRLRGLGVIAWEGQTLTVRKDYLENFMDDTGPGRDPVNGSFR